MPCLKGKAVARFRRKTGSKIAIAPGGGGNGCNIYFGERHDATPSKAAVLMSYESVLYAAHQTINNELIHPGNAAVAAIQTVATLLLAQLAPPTSTLRSKSGATRWWYRELEHR
jgi:hypothetical protein